MRRKIPSLKSPTVIGLFLFTARKSFSRGRSFLCTFPSKGLKDTHQKNPPPRLSTNLSYRRNRSRVDRYPFFRFANLILLARGSAMNPLAPLCLVKTAFFRDSCRAIDCCPPPRRYSFFFFLIATKAIDNVNYRPSLYFPVGAPGIALFPPLENFPPLSTGHDQGVMFLGGTLIFFSDLFPLFPFYPLSLFLTNQQMHGDSGLADFLPEAPLKSPNQKTL